MYQLKSLNDTPSVFFDVNQLSADGTVSLGTTDFSKDGKLMAYSISEAGSDWNIIKVRDVETGEDYPDLIERTKFSNIAWTDDNKGFFYSVSVQTSFKLISSSSVNNLSFAIPLNS